MPTMCRSPVHSAANAASLCVTCEIFNQYSLKPRLLMVCLRFGTWGFLEFGFWSLDLADPCCENPNAAIPQPHPPHQPSTDFRTDRVTACLLHNESASYCPWPA